MWFTYQKDDDTDGPPTWLLKQANFKINDVTTTQGVGGLANGNFDINFETPGDCKITDKNLNNLMDFSNGFYADGLYAH